MKFFADEMLGKLARWLRMAGLDVSYQRSISDEELRDKARRENRIILTRDTRLIPRLGEAESFFISQDHLEDQIQEFFSRFPQLLEKKSPLSRCVECNALLVPIEKAKVKDKVWPYVFQTQDRFTTCPACHRIYWQATHVERIKSRLERMLGSEKKTFSF